MSMAWRVGLQTSHKMALLALCDWANDEGGSLHPSIRRVAERISCSERTAQRILHDLIEGGWLSVVGNPNGGAPGQTRKYQINTDKLALESVTGDRLSGVTNGAETGDKLTWVTADTGDKLTGVTADTGDICDMRRVTNGAETGDTGVTQSTIEPSIKPPYLSSPDKSADRIPACPHLEIINLFGEHLQTLPQPKPELWDGARAKNLSARWKWVLTAKKRSGARYATDKAEAMDFMSRFFAYVAKSDFLTGRDGRWSGCDLAWLMKAENFAKVLQGNYENRGAA